MKPHFLFLAILVGTVVVAGCNDRRSRRLRTDSSVPVDSSASDAMADSSLLDSPWDSAVPVDSGIDSGPPDAGAATCLAELVFTGSGTTGTTAGQPDGWSGSCGGDSASDVLISWTAPSSGAWWIDTFGSSYDTVLYVLDADCSAELACDNNSSGAQSEVMVTAIAGEELMIVVDGFGPASPSSGSFVLNVYPAT